MVYQRKYQKRRVYRKRNNATASMAKKAYYLAKKAQNQKELKFHQIQDLSNTVTSSGEIVALSNVSQGDTNNDREGNVIYPTSIRVKMEINASSGLSRVILFQWLNDGNPVVSDILDAPSVLDFKSDGHRYESRILFDRTVASNINGQQMFKFDITKKLKGLIAYNETTTVPVKNGIYFCLITDNLSGHSYKYTTRLYYKDS